MCARARLSFAWRTVQPARVMHGRWILPNQTEKNETREKKLWIDVIELVQFRSGTLASASPKFTIRQSNRTLMSSNSSSSMAMSSTSAMRPVIIYRSVACVPAWNIYWLWRFDYTLHQTGVRFACECGFFATGRKLWWQFRSHKRIGYGIHALCFAFLICICRFCARARTAHTFI